MFMWTNSDRGIPRSYRMMQGFGVNTFTLYNAQGERFLVKFHFKPRLGVHSFVWDEALKLAGQDPDFHRKDLYEELGLSVPKTWEEAISNGRKAVDSGKIRYGYVPRAQAAQAGPRAAIPRTPAGSGRGISPG